VAEPARNLEPSSQTGASEQEATARRIAMRQNSLNGGGEGNGIPQGNLRSAGSQQHTIDDNETAGFNRAFDAAEQSLASDESDRQVDATRASHAAGPKPGFGAPASTPGKKSGGFANNPGTPVGGNNKFQPGTTRSRDEMNALTGSKSAANPPDKPKDKTTGKPEAAAGGGFVAGMLAKTNATAGWAGKNKKGLFIGGGISGVLATVLIGIFALLPLKLEAFMKAIYGEQGANVEHAIERRAERIFIKYAFQKTLNPEGGIVATGNPLGDLYRTWKVQKFEQHLDEHGVKVEQGAKPGTIRLVVYGEAGVFDNEDELAKYFDKDLEGKTAQKALKLVIRDYTKWYNVFKRRHVRTWMTNAYNLCVNRVKCWSFFKKDESEKDTKANFDENLAKAENDPAQKAIGDGIACAIGETEKCADGTPEEKEEITTPDADKAGAEVTDETGKLVTESAEKAASSGFSKYLAEKIVTILGSKAIPVVGWIDLAAHIDDFLYNKRYEQVVKGIRTVQYAAVFGTWQTIDDQIKDGTTVTGFQVNAALTALDGLEKSRAFQEVFMGKSAGKDVSKLKTVNPFKDLYDGYSKSPMFLVHGVMWAWLHTAGYLLNLVGDGVGWLLSHIPGVSSVEEWVGEHLVKLIELIAGPVVGKKEGGEIIGNAIRVGADVVMNDYAHHQLGGKKLKPSEALAVTNLVNEERRNDGTPLLARLFDTTNPSSLVARLAVTLPSSPMIAARNGFNDMIAYISNPMDWLNHGLQYAYSGASASANAAAESNVDRYGVEHYGWTDKDAFADIDQKQLNDLQLAADKAQADGRSIDQIRASDCPEVKDGEYNYCMLNLVSIQALKANFTTSDDGGFNSDQPSSSSANAAGSGGGIVPPPGQSCGTSSNCAKLLLALAGQGKLKFNGYNAGNGKLEPEKVRHDLELTAANQPIHNADSCNNDVTLHPMLLNALYQSILHFGEVTVDSFVTTHGGSCSSTRYHPQGRAMDVWNVNNVRTGPSSMSKPAKYNQAFAEFIVQYLPKPEGEILQANKCFPANIPASIGQRGDTCDHIHVSVGNVK
jgi:hypothetical protein